MNRRKFLGIVSTGLFIGCGPRPTTERWPYHPGEVVRCGSFSFNVLEIEYKSQLGDGVLAKRPKHGFLLLRIQATSSAGDVVAIPFLRLETASGEVFTEVEDGSSLPNWLGLLRRVDPGATETGWIAFDVPPSVYGLRLSDGNLDNEQTAMVQIAYHPESSITTTK